jgi:hypothetical protein
MSTLKSRLLLSALSAVAASYCVAPAHAATVINTPIIGAGPLLPWGPAFGSNNSFGLVFTAPEPILVDYSLSVGTVSGPGFPFVSQVYAWNGTNRTTGPALFTSTEDTTTASLVTYTPYIRVTPGSEYIAFVTNQPGGVSLGGMGVGEMQQGTGPATFSYASANPTLGAWSGFPLNASFRADLAVPEPSTWAMMLFGFAGLGSSAIGKRGRPSVRRHDG